MPRPFQGLVRLGAERVLLYVKAVRRQCHPGGRVGIRPGRRMPTQPHVSSSARHLEGVEARLAASASKCMRRRRESRGRNGETKGGLDPGGAEGAAKNTAPSRAGPHLGYRVPVSCTHLIGASPRLRRREPARVSLSRVGPPAPTVCAVLRPGRRRAFRRRRRAATACCRRRPVPAGPPRWWRRHYRAPNPGRR